MRSGISRGAFREYFLGLHERGCCEGRLLSSSVFAAVSHQAQGSAEKRYQYQERSLLAQADPSASDARSRQILHMAFELERAHTTAAALGLVEGGSASTWRHVLSFAL